MEEPTPEKTGMKGYCLHVMVTSHIPLTWQRQFCMVQLKGQKATEEQKENIKGLTGRSFVVVSQLTKGRKTNQKGENLNIIVCASTTKND